MNPILEQIKFMNKVSGGLGKLLRTRRKHALGLKFIRGYAATTCFWSLSNAGLFDELLEKDRIDLAEFARRKGMNIGALRAVCEYLDGIKILNYEGEHCSLDETGKTLLEEPRGLFELLYGYEPVFTSLNSLVQSEKQYGRDLCRRADAVARGSGALGRQFPFLAVRELVYEHGFRRVLDLGCGDLEFLLLLCEKQEITAVGIDNNADALECARRRLNKHNDSRISISLADMFQVEKLAADFPDVEAIIAIDVFHEYLSDGSAPIIELLKKYKAHFPNAHLVVAEFFKLPRVWLRRIPTTTLEHHLFHSLTNQIILPIGEWIQIFEKSGYQIINKKLVHGIGHAYFVLK